MTAIRWYEIIQRRTVVVDVETTGLSDDDRIVSLGAILLDPATRSIDGRHLIFNPERGCHPRARAVHGYDDYALRKQDRFVDHAEDISSFIGSADRIVGHNLAFDFGFIESELLRTGKPPLSADEWCTMNAHRASGIGGSASLTRIAKTLGLQRVGSKHGAIEDAWLTLHVFLAQNGLTGHLIAEEWRSLVPTNLRVYPNHETNSTEIDRILERLLVREPSLRPIPNIGDGPKADDEPIRPLFEEQEDIDGLAVGILYRDQGGRESSRTIRCYELCRSEDAVFLVAHCHLRGQTRNFRLDRVLNVYDYTTGELISTAEQFFGPRIPESWPYPWARKSHDNARYRLGDVKSRFESTTRVLMFIAMQDGSLHPEEFRLILKHALEQIGDDVDNELRRAVAEWIRNYLPSRRSATIALGKLLEGPDCGLTVANALIDVMLADGEATDDEMKAAWSLVEYMARRERDGRR